MSHERMVSPIEQWLAPASSEPAFYGTQGLRVTTRAAFALSVARAARSLESLPVNARIAIDEGDLGAFTILLMAVLWTGRTPVLFAGRGAQYEALQNEYDAVLTRQSDVVFPKPACVVSDDAVPVPFDALEAPEATRSLMLYTSGSAGQPKRIEKTVGLMSCEAEVTKRLFGKRLIGTILAVTVDPRHLYGLTFGVWMAMTTGTPVAAERVAYQEQLLGWTKPLSVITTPTFMRMLDVGMAKPDFAFALTAAGVLDTEALTRFAAWSGSDLHEIYGSTETGVVASRVHQRGELNPLWTLIDEGSLKETVDGWQLSSPLVAGGALMLDDKLQLESDHVFTLLGRKDRIVKIGEVRLSLTEIERVVKDVMGLTVRALPIEQGPRTVIGAVVNVAASPGWTGRCPNRVETTAALAGRLDPLARPRVWRSTAVWPTDSQGKVVVPMLKELFK